MGKPHIACALLAGLACTACSSPLVKYSPVTGADEDGLTKFQFAESIVTFTYGKTPAGIPNDDIIISSVPVPYGERKFALSGTGFWENWGVVTLVNVLYRGDTDLLQKVTVSMTDEREQAIQTLGSIAATVGGLLSISRGEETVSLPTGIAVTSFLERIPEGCVAKDGRDGAITCSGLALLGTKDFTADISVGPRPLDAIPSSKMDNMFYSSSFFYSACRQMTITLLPRPGLDMLPVSATVAVADPLYLETLRIPAKGSITVAPSCGANSVAEDPGLQSELDILNALATQAKALKEALHGSHNSGTTKN